VNLSPRVTAVLSALLVALLAGCQLQPTKVGESRQRGFAAIVGKTRHPLVLSEQTVVLDARSPFDFGLNRIQNSLNLTWSDLDLDDLRRSAQRLALLGVAMDTPVVVVGYGPKGQGEEGRLAWSLLYLGLHDVQVAGVELFRANWGRADAPPTQNAPPWTSEPRDGLIIGKQEFMNLAKDPKRRLESRIHILDVRSAKEYFNKVPSAPGPAPDIHAIQIEWKDFYGADGRPSAMIVKKLAGLDIRPDDQVILLSNRGVRSGAAAYALIALGFKRVRNFTGGWRAFLNSK
jgi:3-mercaptopyruvate sulfurtransferase SseA